MENQNKNFTPIKNYFIDNKLVKMNLSSYESRVLWVIFRIQYGYQNNNKTCTSNYISTATELDKSNTRKILEKLKKRNIIKNISKSEKINVWVINENYSQWDKSEQMPNQLETMQPLPNGDQSEQINPNGIDANKPKRENYNSFDEWNRATDEYLKQVIV